MSENNQHWVLERKVPVAVITIFFIQVITVIVWATQLAARVEHVEQKALSNEVASEKFARLEERLEHIREDITIIRRQIEKATDQKR